MISLPTIFAMNFVEVWQSPHTHKFFDDAEWHTRRCADEPKGNSQLLTTVAQMKDFFFLLYILLQIQAARNQ